MMLVRPQFSGPFGICPFSNAPLQFSETVAERLRPILAHVALRHLARRLLQPDQGAALKRV